MKNSVHDLWSSSIDMNLLPTLDALLRERNVTRAAEKLGISQPSASGALARLRRHFNDELLCRTGNRYQLTPLGAQLLGHTGQALAGVRRVFDSTTNYDAAGSTREFRLVMHDYSAMVIADVLLRQFRDSAPSASMHLEQTVGSVLDGDSEALMSVDGAVLPPGAAPRRRRGRPVRGPVGVHRGGHQRRRPADEDPPGDVALGLLLRPCHR